MDELAEVLQVADVIVPLLEKIIDDCDKKDIGKKIAKIQLDYIDCLVSGGLTKEEAIELYRVTVSKIGAK